eukprot:scaffold1401_cov350-Prasinococcus_capsulatus_cf.AAC.2
MLMIIARPGRRTAEKGVARAWDKARAQAAAHASLGPARSPSNVRRERWRRGDGGRGDDGRGGACAAHGARAPQPQRLRRARPARAHLRRAAAAAVGALRNGDDGHRRRRQRR